MTEPVPKPIQDQIQLIRAEFNQMDAPVDIGLHARAIERAMDNILSWIEPDEPTQALAADLRRNVRQLEAGYSIVPAERPGHQHRLDLARFALDGFAGSLVGVKASAAGRDLGIA